MTAWVFEARHCPKLLNEIKKTKLEIYTSPQAGINILLAACGFVVRCLSDCGGREKIKKNGEGFFYQGWKGHALLQALVWGRLSGDLQISLTGMFLVLLYLFYHCPLIKACSKL
jgi:hypothetical protein